MSKHWLQSLACAEELAYAIAESKCIDAVSVDGTQSIEGMPAQIFGDTNHFEQDFFGNFTELVARICKHLPKSTVPASTLLCEESTLQFSLTLQQSLTDAGLDVVLSSDTSGEPLCLHPGSILLPVLSGPFLSSAICTTTLCEASSQAVQILPVLYDYNGFSTAARPLLGSLHDLIDESSSQSSRNAIKLAHVNSILNQVSALCVPNL